MVCEHLRQLEEELKAAGMVETLRGKTWTKNCREFVYFDCVLDRASLQERLNLADCVKDSEYLGTHMGSEYGFYCETCQDGIMGRHPKDAGGSPTFR